MLRESIIKMKNGMAAGPSGLSIRNGKISGRNKNCKNGLVNPIIVEGVTLAEWGFKIIAHC